MKAIKIFSVTIVFLLLASCNGALKTVSSPGGELSDPKSSIQYQLDLIKAGDYEKLKECFTDRVKGGITKDAVDKAKSGDIAKYTIDDLYASAEDSDAEGRKAKKIKMKNGRTLTILINTDGKWLADTVWFK